MIITEVEDLRRRAGQPGDHPRPRRHRRGLRRAGRRGSGCTAPTTSSAGPPGSTSRRSGSPRRRGLAHVAAQLGVDAADVLAIGDGRNDIEMLRWAGRGVAMGQAVEEVTRRPTTSPATVYDDGAATELARWFRVTPDPPGRHRPRRHAACAPTASCPTSHAAGAGRRVDDHGVPVVFVTGRPLRWAADVFDHVGAHGLAVVSNGALVWDVARRQPLRAAHHRARRRGSRCAAGSGRRSRACRSRWRPSTASRWSPSSMERHPVPDGSRRGPIAELFTEPALKLLARHEELAPGVLGPRGRGRRRPGRRHLVVDVHPARDQRRRGHQGDDPGLLCDELGVDAARTWSRSATCPTTCAMLTWAGTSYAMANAHPTVVAAADHVAPGHDDDGVARVLAASSGCDLTCGRHGAWPSWLGAARAARAPRVPSSSPRAGARRRAHCQRPDADAGQVDGADGGVHAAR